MKHCLRIEWFILQWHCI